MRDLKKMKTCLNNVQLHVRTGICDHERLRTQSVTVDVEMTQNIATAKISPASISEVLDYDRVYQYLGSLENAEHSDLIESIANRIALFCLEDRRVAEVLVRVTKNTIYEGRAFPSFEVTMTQEG